MSAMLATSVPDTPALWSGLVNPARAATSASESRVPPSMADVRAPNVLKKPAGAHIVGYPRRRQQCR